MKPLKPPSRFHLLNECPPKYLHVMADIIKTYDFPILIADDITAYCAVFYFYMKEYRKALSLLASLEKMLLARKAQYLSCDSSGTFSKDIFGFKFSVMSLNECYYAMLLCNLQLGELAEALKVANQLLITIKPQVSFWIVAIRYIIQETLNQPSKSLLRL